MRKGYDLEERFIEFAVHVIHLSEALPKTVTGKHIAGQLIRSGTSPAPNYAESRSAESRQDFVHKLKIALKELRESLVWLKILNRLPIGEAYNLGSIIDENEQLIAILVSSIQTARRKPEICEKALTSPSQVRLERSTMQGLASRLMSAPEGLQKNIK